MANYGKGREPYLEWSDAEIAALEKLFPRASWQELRAAIPRRTRGAIRQMAKNVLKLRREINRREKWTNEENEILRGAYPKVSDAELKRRLPRHSFIAIQRRASDFGILRPRQEAREHGRHIPPLIEQLYRARLNQHMRRPVLAKKLGYAHGQILGWELGKTNPEFRIVVLWAEALGFEVIMRPKLKEIPSIIRPLDKSKLMAGKA